MEDKMKEREIKFRAWDTESKEMEDDVWGTWNAVANGDGVNVYMDEARRFYKKVIMQFTGLVDCNGVDIYEGDIVKFYSPMPSMIDKDEIVRVVSWDDALTGFYPFNAYDYDCDQYFPLEDFRLLGNIYENPDLAGDDN